MNNINKKITESELTYIKRIKEGRQTLLDFVKKEGLDRESINILIEKERCKLESSRAFLKYIILLIPIVFTILAQKIFLEYFKLYESGVNAGDITIISIISIFVLGFIIIRPILNSISESNGTIDNLSYIKNFLPEKIKG